MLEKKIIYSILLIMIMACSKKPNIAQAVPFENLVIAIKTDSTSLFSKSFSLRVHNENNDTLNWNERMFAAKEVFKSEYTELNTDDFTYEFDNKYSKLIVKHKMNDPFKLKVVFENGEWKLDEH